MNKNFMDNFDKEAYSLILGSSPVLAGDVGVRLEQMREFWSSCLQFTRSFRLEKSEVYLIRKLLCNEEREGDGVVIRFHVVCSCYHFGLAFYNSWVKQFERLGLKGEFYSSFLKLEDGEVHKISPFILKGLKFKIMSK